MYMYVMNSNSKKIRFIIIYFCLHVNDSMNRFQFIRKINELTSILLYEGKRKKNDNNCPPMYNYHITVFVFYNYISFSYF